MQDPGEPGGIPVATRSRPSRGFARKTGSRIGRGAVVTAVTFGVGLSYDSRAGAISPGALIGPVPTIAPAPLIGPVPAALPARTIGPVPLAAPAVAAAPAAVTASPKSRERAAALSRLQVVAHRGGTVWGPESTLTTFEHALDIGSHAIEFDVQFTKDGVPVVLHDPTLERTTDCSGPVAAITLAKLKTCDAGRWYKPNPIEDEEVPTLDEALDLLEGSGAQVYLHVKLASESQARKIVNLLDEYGMNSSAKASNPAVLIADSRAILTNLKAAGGKRLGYVFNNAAGWSADYPVLVPLRAPISRDRVAKAQKRGQYVTMVQYGSLTLNKLADLRLDGFMVNDPDALIGQLERVDTDNGRPGGARPGDGRDGADGQDGSDGSDGADGGDA